MKFLKPHNHHKSKTIIKQVTIGMSTYFNCPIHTSVSLRMLHTPVFPEIRHTSLFPGISYKWGNRYKNSSEDFDIKTSERVWVTTKGVLVFRVFKQEDAELINKTGIRCIVEQRTSFGRRTIMSNVFRVLVRSKCVASRVFKNN